METFETYSFDDFVIDVDAFEVRRDGDRLTFEPLVFETLLFLVRNAGRMVTRDELIEAVWDGRFISDSSVSTAIKSLRRLLGDTGSEQTYVKTIRGRGYTFIGQLTRDTGTHETTVTRPVDSATDFANPALAIRVIDLAGPAEGGRARGFHFKLRATLSRIPLLAIAARPFDEGSDTVATLLADVALDQDAESNSAVVTLNDLLDGTQVWARTITQIGPPDDGALVSQAVAHLEPAIQKLMVRQLKSSAFASRPHAYLVEAVAYLSTNGWNSKSFPRAKALLEEAIALNSELHLAHAYLALLHAFGWRVGATPTELSRKAALEAAQKAMESDEENSIVLGLVGCAFCDVGDLERGDPLLDRAMEIDPQNGHALTAKGAKLMIDQDFDTASQFLRKGIDISPADPRLSVWGALLALSELHRGDLGAALKEAKLACARDDRNPLPRLARAIILVSSGEFAKAKVSVEDLLRVHPDIKEDEVSRLSGPDLASQVSALIAEVQEAKREAHP